MVPPVTRSHLKHLDYSVLQQCMHCGMCLPTCPTYDATKQERNSPRGRIALMRSIADGKLEVTRTFEAARADIEDAKVLHAPQRALVRAFALRFVFARPLVLRAFGRLLQWYQ